MNDTRREYLKRINIVLDFIEKNLDTDLSLEYLSEKAYYSPYHFHRIFLAVVGERLNEYINRKRLERIASILIVDQNVSLKNIAFQYGFNSDSSFSRAFKKYYGISPTKFKTEGEKILRKIGIEPFSVEKYICAIDNHKQWMKMNAQITIKELPIRKLASISHIGDFSQTGAMFQKLMSWGHEKGILDTNDFKAVTIYHDNPNVTQTSRLRFSAGVTISEDITAQGEIRQINLKKGIYVVGHFEIIGEDISKAWENMWIWVIENGYQFRDGDYFEVYHNDHRTHPEHKFIIDICIPLERTENIKLEKASDVNFKQKKDYHQLINYMKALKAYFHKEYDTYFKLGNVYQGSPDYSYLSLTTEELKEQKLKFVIILDHKTPCFSICLSGQNKAIRKTYWELFKNSDWNKYHLAESIDKSLSIIDQIIVENPDFDNKRDLTELIEKESLKFINDIKDILA